MEVLKANNLVVRLKKCTFCQPSVAYLGHVISHKGVTTDPSKVEAIRNRKTPQNVTELKEFLGMAGYYRRYKRLWVNMQTIAQYAEEGWV